MNILAQSRRTIPTGNIDLQLPTSIIGMLSWLVPTTLCHCWPKDLVCPLIEGAEYITFGGVGKSAWYYSLRLLSLKDTINQSWNALECCSPIAMATPKYGIIHFLKAWLFARRCLPVEEVGRIIRWLALIRSSDNHNRSMLRQHIDCGVHIADSGGVIEAPCI